MGVSCLNSQKKTLTVQDTLTQINTKQNKQNITIRSDTNQTISTLNDLPNNLAYYFNQNYKISNYQYLYIQQFNGWPYQKILSIITKYPYQLISRKFNIDYLEKFKKLEIQDQRNWEKFWENQCQKNNIRQNFCIKTNQYQIRKLNYTDTETIRYLDLIVKQNQFIVLHGLQYFWIRDNGQIKSEKIDKNVIYSKIDLSIKNINKSKIKLSKQFNKFKTLITIDSHRNQIFYENYPFQTLNKTYMQIILKKLYGILPINNNETQRKSIYRNFIMKQITNNLFIDGFFYWNSSENDSIENNLISSILPIFSKTNNFIQILPKKMVLLLKNKIQYRTINIDQLPNYFNNFSYLQYKSFMIANNYSLFDESLLSKLTQIKPLSNIRVSILISFIKHISTSKNILNTIKRLLCLKDSEYLELLCIYLKIRMYLQIEIPDKYINIVLKSIVNCMHQDIAIIVQALGFEFGIEFQDDHFNFRKDRLFFWKFQEKKQQQLPCSLLSIEYVNPNLINQHIEFLELIYQYSPKKIKQTMTKFLQIQSSLSKYLQKKQNLKLSTVVFLQEWKMSIKAIKILIKQLSTKQFQQSYYQQKDNFDQITQQFYRMSYCSSQIALLLFSGFYNKYRNNQNNFIKLLDIIHRIYQDPRTKYLSYQGYYGPYSGKWQQMIIQQLLNSRTQKSQFSQSFQSTFSNRSQWTTKQQVVYLQNIIECIKINQSNRYQKYNQQIQQILKILPTNHTNYKINYRRNIWQDTCIISNYSQSISSQKGQSLNSTTRKLKNKSIYSKIQSLNSTISLKLYQGIIFWGNNLCYPIIQPQLKDIQVIKISCGNFHTIFATKFQVYGFGENSVNQLGQSTYQTTQNQQQKKFSISNPALLMIFEQPIPPNPKTSQLMLGCGNQHTVVLYRKFLYMWGQNQGGILGGAGYQFDYIACGGLHTIGLKDNQAYSWGRGQGGQLGHPVQQLQQKQKQQTVQFFISYPKKIQKLPQISKIECGDAHTIALTTNKQVYVFGFSYQGQLGLGITGQNQQFQIFEPTKLTYFNDKNIQIADIYTGGTCSFFKTIQGQLYCCGLNDCYQLGIDRVMKIFNKQRSIQKNNSKSNLYTIDNDYDRSKIYPVKKKKLKRLTGDPQFSIPKKLQIFDQKNTFLTLKHLVCGENHSIASVQYGNYQMMIMGWGDNRQWQISYDAAEITAPRSIDSLFGVKIKQIGCGSNFSMILTETSNLGRSDLIDFLKKIIKKYQNNQEQNKSI